MSEKLVDISVVGLAICQVCYHAKNVDDDYDTFYARFEGCMCGILSFIDDDNPLYRLVHFLFNLDSIRDLYDDVMAFQGDTDDLAMLANEVVAQWFVKRGVLTKECIIDKTNPN